VSESSRVPSQPTQASQPSPVRIVVAERASGPGRTDPGIRRALERLGDGVELLVFEDTAAARDAAAEADLVVVDLDLGQAGLDLLAALRGSGPPVLVVTADRAEPVVLDAFRRGAADCVAAGPDLAEVLPVAALEHLRRFRADRTRQAARHGAELARRVDELERYTENIIQNMNSALLVVDLDGRITFANPTAERILAAEAGALRGRLVWDWFPNTPRQQIFVARTLDEGVRFRGAEAVLAPVGGPVVPIGVSCAPLTDTDGTPLGAVAIFQDLTEIKQLQRQVLQTEKLASIGQLAAGIAHEINNPMGFIHANLFQMAEYVEDLGRLWETVGALRKAVAAGSHEEARREACILDELELEVDSEYLLSDFAKAVRESLEGSERIRHIVQDLRAFSHQDTEEPVEADVNQCLDSTVNIVWTMMKHSVVLTREYEDLPRLRCHPMQLKQVFMNLIVNAYQAIEQQAGEGRPPGEIRLRTAGRAGGVTVSVEDNGPGIPPEHLERIFDPFFTTKEVGVGTGLGLSTSFNIVRRHGGSLRVTSRPGEGARFEVFLPWDPEAARPEEGRV
jgi:PAS domain S-box-containing protein